MLERKDKISILSLNLKNLGSRADDLKIILTLQNEMLILMFFYNCVIKQKEDIPRNHYITVYIIIFGEQYVLIFSVKISHLKIF